MGDIHLILDNMRDFMHSSSVVSVDEDTLQIIYTWHPYDSIDDDLDFNEDWYDQMKHNYERLLLTECKDAVRNGTYKLVTCQQGARGVEQHDVDIVMEQSMYMSPNFRLVVDTRTFE